MNPYPGLFIVFEGIDGSGKTTQVKLLSRYLKKQHPCEVITVKEPASYYEIPDGISPQEKLLLISANRYRLVHEVIIPALKKKAIVICDRYTQSSIVYQHYGQGIPLFDVQDLIDFSTSGLTPDVTFLLDIDPMNLEGRLTEKGERFTDRELNLLHYLILKYRDLTNEDPDCFKIAGDSPRFKTHLNILENLKEVQK
jgi:dTMP kinase